MFELHPELAQLEKNIAETQRLVSRQVARIERMTEQEADTEMAKAVLQGLAQVLYYFYAQRERILDILTRQ
jgi:vacuolar-type H+-ATPase subunit E/Vma4